MANPTDPTIHPPTIANLLSASYQDGPDWRYKIVNDYLEDEGLLVLPVAGPPGTPPHIVQVCAPTVRRHIRWTATRQGLPPLIPRKDPPDENHVFLRRVFSPESEDIADDGRTKIYTRSGEYVYQLLVPPTDSDPYPVGAPPALTTTLDESTVQPEEFITGIIQEEE